MTVYNNRVEQAILLAGIIAGTLSKWSRDNDHPLRIIHIQPGVPMVVDMGGIEFEISVKIKDE